MFVRLHKIPRYQMKGFVKLIHLSSKFSALSLSICRYILSICIVSDVSNYPMKIMADRIIAFYYNFIVIYKGQQLSMESLCIVQNAE